MHAATPADLPKALAYSVMHVVRVLSAGLYILTMFFLKSLHLGGVKEE